MVLGLIEEAQGRDLPVLVAAIFVHRDVAKYIIGKRHQPGEDPGIVYASAAPCEGSAD
jgi:hypothetical protein